MEKGLRFFLIICLTMVFCAPVFQGCTKSAASLDKQEERDPHMRRARLKTKAQEIDEAIAIYQQAIDKDPKMARAHLELALLLDKHKEDFIRAIYHYQRYIELRPDAEKRQMIEDLVRYAKISFATTLPEKSSESVQLIATLQQENAKLREQLRAARIASETSSPVTSKPAPSPVSASTPAPAKPSGDAGISAKVVAESARRSPGAIPEAPPAAPAMQTYKVQRNDTLSKIAKKMYNDSSRWREIYDANRNVLKSPESLQLDQTLIIPQL